MRIFKVLILDGINMMSYQVVRRGLKGQNTRNTRAKEQSQGDY